ncbi:unnamed protein product [Ilex paraguariensis]|uniref:Uncharacterized protein n=1 Tax=Ilex paraguariensis TaxID=185542 RepID=A0ABC8UA48_9AQUA
MVENELATTLLRGDFKEEDSVIIDADVSTNDRPPHKRLIIKKLGSTSDMGAMVVND